MFGIDFAEIGKIIDGWFPKPEAVKPVMVKPVTQDNEPTLLSDLNDLEVVARTIWGEARNQGVLGMTGVACVIMNRTKIGGWFGGSPREVCLKPFQFSAWNKDDPNRAKLLGNLKADPEYMICLSLANSILTGTLKDIVCDADSYEVRGTNAFWARGLTPVKSIEAHDFYCTRQA